MAYAQKGDDVHVPQAKDAAADASMRHTTYP